MNYNSVIAAIERPNFKDSKIKKYQSTRDIIRELIDCFKLYNYQAIPIVKKYYTGNFKTDAKNIYDFIRKNIEYEAESEQDQTSRSFSRIIHDKWGDCKHSALIVGSIGWNEGYNVIFRVVEYESFLSNDIVTHVYTILEDPKTGSQIIVDPLQKFNYEKEYSRKIGDYKAEKTNKNMTLSRLTGVPNFSASLIPTETTMTAKSSSSMPVLDVTTGKISYDTVKSTNFVNSGIVPPKNTGIVPPSNKAFSESLPPSSPASSSYTTSSHPASLPAETSFEFTNSYSEGKSPLIPIANAQKAQIPMFVKILGIAVVAYGVKKMLS